MSVELFGYSANPTPVSVEELAALCRKRGIEARVIREGSTPIVKGHLLCDDVIVGWRISSTDNRAAAEAAANADWKAIDKLHERDGIGSCAVDIMEDPAVYNDDKKLADLMEIYGPQYIACRVSSRVRWYARISGGNELSSEVAEIVLRSLVELRGGVFEDPQSGNIEIVQKN